MPCLRSRETAYSAQVNSIDEVTIPPMNDSTDSAEIPGHAGDGGQSERIADTDLTARHLRIGWQALLLFLSLGIVLEGLHAFKVGWYLDVGNEARRLMWRLAHAHGTLLSLVNLAFGLTVSCQAVRCDRSVTAASLALIAATILLPGGFFLGGLFIYPGDPGFGVWLVPIGATTLFIAVFLTARAVGRGPDERES